jgi:ascorbate-specific PTS system EIIC-type component UlaA
MNSKIVGAILALIGVVLIVAGATLITLHYYVINNHVNGLTIVNTLPVKNYFMAFFGVGVLYFGIHFLIAKQDRTVTLIEEELLKRAGEQGEN